MGSGIEVGMDRRRFLKLAGVAAVAMPLSAVAEPVQGTYGRVDATEHDYAHNLRAFLDGAEVTNRCRVADDREGFVELYDEPLTVKGNRVVTRRFYGRVRIEPKA